MPVFCISDLHMGDGGPRDNFAYGGHEKKLMSFLDFVQAYGGRLIICGDLFELWQSNISKVLTKRMWLLDRLAAMGAIYVLGNHDADLKYFVGREDWLRHPFFKTMCDSHTETIGGKPYHFIHGHEADPYCSGDAPGLGRITAIYSGLAEDKNGSPMLTAGRTVEGKVVGRLEKLVSCWGQLRGRPDRNTEMNQKLRDIRDEKKANIVCGHTHFAGQIREWHFNCGTWAEIADTYVTIGGDGQARVMQFQGEIPSATGWGATPYNKKLPI